MSVEYTTERAATIADKIIGLQADIEEREEAIKNLKLKLASLYDNSEGEYVEDGRKITVYFHKAINAAYAKKNEPELYAKGSATETVFTAATAKKSLTDEEYARVQKRSDTPSVKIDLVED